MRAHQRLSLCLLVPLTVLLVVVAVFSLQWRIKHDAALMLYFAYLIDHFDFVPYRDLFEHQPPGAHWTFLFAGKVFGYGDLGFRVFDLLTLAALQAATWAWMSTFSRTVAWAGSVLFGVAYLGMGPNVSAQRDYLLLLPIALALWLHVGFPAWNERRRALAAGVLLGLPMTIKPQVGLLVPAILCFHAWRVRAARGAGRDAALVVALGGLAAALPIAASLAVLAVEGTLGSFVDVVREYWPLFGSLDGKHRISEGWERLDYIAEHYRRFGGHQLWLAPAVLGVFLSLFLAPLGRERRAQVVLMAALCFLASVFTAASGRFWSYHWLVFLYFLLQLAALCLVPAPPGARAAQQLVPLAVLAAVVVCNVPVPFAVREQIAGRPLPLPNYGRADEIAEYLRDRMQPGDTVQALDWTGGAVHAMLIARAEAATPYVTDFSFHHHVSDPYIQGLREDFLDAFARARPRFVAHVHGRRDRPKGPDTTRDLAELDAILARDYTVAREGFGYRIYERSGSGR